VWNVGIAIPVIMFAVFLYTYLQDEDWIFKCVAGQLLKLVKCCDLIDLKAKIAWIVLKFRSTQLTGAISWKWYRRNVTFLF
jgi:hypothetical protein